ncbi:hypothetical protein A9Q68_00760 [Streptococcus bovimastitidis]|uniref:Helix-hairpin-helix DNA-binding motif class 1 domain-containing protein n=1 Tax=Streptococcus bovimastitidis TaxID=1856638 RepID=A0A1L8MMV3_9STRE|nr:helix-hairpin-helix domain-containing protein [Streptococcus bovimastitidis]OJF72104.1 hypothetical protein A9Q68_00760 [Streptococcus bovimastitidis]
MLDKLLALKDRYPEIFNWTNLLTVFLSLALLVTLGLFFFGDNSSLEKKTSNVNFDTVAKSSEASAELAESKVRTDKTTIQEIVVDLKGAVKKEGVYHLPLESRVADLIEMAGGLLESAEPKAINLAQKLSDGSVIYVAQKGEAKAVNLTENLSSESSQAEVGKGKVNINRASIDDLQKIPGIGEKRAQEIIEAREAVGGFKKLEDLLKISGIGKKTIEKLKNEISLD